MNMLMRRRLVGCATLFLAAGVAIAGGAPGGNPWQHAGIAFPRHGTRPVATQARFS